MEKVKERWSGGNYTPGRAGKEAKVVGNFDSDFDSIKDATSPTEEWK